MTNERYQILCATYEAAHRGLGCGLLYFLSPPGRGKTQTREIFKKDHTRTKLIPAGTENFIYTFMSQNASDLMFIIDDKTEWITKDFGNGIAYLKMAGTGRLRRMRMNFSTAEDAEKPMMCIGVLMMNPDQANTVASYLRATGFEERALKIQTLHTRDSYAKIKVSYHAHGWNRNNLPKLKLPDKFFKDDNEINPSVDKWISENFLGENSDTVRLIASVIYPEAFEDLKPVLLSGQTRTEYHEKIEFDCDCEVCHG